MSSRQIPLRRVLPWLAASFLLALAAPAGAARITLRIADAAGEGFNDPTPKSPVAGNPGTTVGDQRLNAFEAVAREWGNRLASDVDIVVSADWDDFEDDCEPRTGPIAGAGPEFVVRAFPNAPNSAWHVAAQAEALAGRDLIPDSDIAIGATFNSGVGSAGCLTTLSWDYRIGAGSPNRRQISFVDTVIHEITHGLGFINLAGEGSGFAKFEGRDDAFIRLLEDHSTGKKWSKMTNRERRNSATDTGDLHWVGTAVIAAGSALVEGRHRPSGHPLMYAPDPLEPGSSVAHFDPSLDANTSDVIEPFDTRRSDMLVTDHAMQDLGWGVNYPAARSIRDLNANGADDLAILRTADSPGGHKVVLLDGATRQLIREIFLPAELSAIDLGVVPHFDGSGDDEIAVLTWRKRRNQIRVRLYDAGSGGSLGNISFPKGVPSALEVVSSAGGSSADDLVVLWRLNNGSNKVRVKDPQSGANVSTVTVPKTHLATDLAIVPNFGGGPAGEVALALEDLATGSGEIRVFDAASGAELSRFALDPDIQPQHLAAVDDLGGGGAPEVAVVGQRGSNARPRMIVADAGTGTVLTDVDFGGADFVPLAIERVADFANSPADELTVLGKLNGNRKARVWVVDASSGATIRSFTEPVQNNPRALAVVPNLGATRADDLVIITTVTRDGSVRAILRDPSNGTTLANVVLP